MSASRYVKAIKMIPVECVVRNICAADGEALRNRAGIPAAEPIFEFFYKSDELHDPLCNTTTCHPGWGTAADVAKMRTLTPRSTPC